ncbi:MAG: NAD-dependent epimerase/dehydratase family protein, partial [Gammaproteobacteria bacterium]|nr:NAD-dependent epimerase/dehydratase family protein [Gammaproteobacteria bacterium]
MKVLITGGAGFVGANLAHYLSGRGHRVTVMDNLVRRGSELNLLPLKAAGVQFVHGDVRNAEDFANVPRDIEVVLETCAQPSAIDGYANPLFDINNNTIGLLNTLEFARKSDAGLIFWSTNKTYAGEHINAFPLVERETRWEWDTAAIDAIYGERLPAGFDPVYGFSSEFTVDGHDHSIYGLSKIMADLACQGVVRRVRAPHRGQPLQLPRGTGPVRQVGPGLGRLVGHRVPLRAAAEVHRLGRQAGPRRLVHRGHLPADRDRDGAVGQARRQRLQRWRRQGHHPQPPRSHG